MGRGRCLLRLTATVLLSSSLAKDVPPSGSARKEAPTPTLEERVKGAMWGLLIGDALAMPAHWYYGGPQQIRRDFGDEIKGYESSRHPFPESIMQLSDTGGAGRGNDDGDIIGNVILHGKKEFWRRGGQYHYHHGMHTGENTLEAQLSRLVMRGITTAGGEFAASKLRNNYVEFMTQPGSHNDSYASTCHRMFFRNRAEGRNLEDCPDNDGHNVDTMDGLVMPIPVILAKLARNHAGVNDPAAVERAASEAASCIAVTRKSGELPGFASLLSSILQMALQGRPLRDLVDDAAKQGYGENADMGRQVEQRRGQDPMVACYISGGFPALLHFLWKYAASDPEVGLLASVNAGGENVHRGAVLGAVVGAAAGVRGLPAWLLEGLYKHDEISLEIDAFVKALGLSGPGNTLEL